MKIKWYTLAFLICLSLLSVLQSKTNTPNQEIVLQFQNVESSNSETNTSISKIKQILHSIGVESLDVVFSEHGTFRIVYYSNFSVAKIKNLLRAKTLTVLENESKEQPSKYAFEIFKINTTTDTPWGFEGYMVSQIQLKSDRSSQLDHYKFFSSKLETNVVSILHSILKLNTNVAITATGISFNIPEVRAGPSA